nr:HAD family hydrolase [Desulfobulbaceae bacterium]
MSGKERYALPVISHRPQTTNSATLTITIRHLTHHIKAVLFDLDGTLLDTVDDLADSMNAALATLGYPTHPVESYKHFVGNGLSILSRRVLPQGLDTDEHLVSRCSDLMLSEYELRWSNKTRLYPGISELLTELQLRNLVLNILSNKPHAPTKKAVDHFLSSWPFRHVDGAKPGVPRKPDPTAATAIARQCGISSSDFLYLGDTNTDMETAISAA